ncbi:MAG: hypothetical protein JO086_00140 [Acidimicrobiia bacterium]|nr:hypothetical protein [Acidimicrobiia bacterium]
MKRRTNNGAAASRPSAWVPPVGTAEAPQLPATALRYAVVVSRFKEGWSLPAWPPMAVYLFTSEDQASKYGNRITSGDAWAVVELSALVDGKVPR